MSVRYGWTKNVERKLKEKTRKREKVRGGYKRKHGKEERERKISNHTPPPPPFIRRNCKTTRGEETGGKVKDKGTNLQVEQDVLYFEWIKLNNKKIVLSVVREKVTLKLVWIVCMRWRVMRWSGIREQTLLKHSRQMCSSSAIERKVRI